MPRSCPFVHETLNSVAETLRGETQRRDNRFYLQDLSSTAEVDRLIAEVRIAALSKIDLLINRMLGVGVVSKTFSTHHSSRWNK